MVAKKYKSYCYIKNNFQINFSSISGFLLWKMISCVYHHYHFDGLVQDSSNSIPNAMDLLQYCSKPSIWFYISSNITPFYWNRPQPCTQICWYKRSHSEYIWLPVSAIYLSLYQSWASSIFIYSTEDTDGTFHLYIKDLLARRVVTQVWIL